MRLIRFKQRKGHSPVSLLKNVLYISISLLHTCCICVAFDINSNTSDGIPQLLQPLKNGLFLISSFLKSYLLLNCGARRAALRPYFFLSFILGSLVKKPAFLSAGRYSSESTSRRALEIPCLIAPA